MQNWKFYLRYKKRTSIFGQKMVSYDDFNYVFDTIRRVDIPDPFSRAVYDSDSH